MARCVVGTFGATYDGGIRMNYRNLTRRRVMVDIADLRRTIQAALALMSLGLRQVYRLLWAL